MLDRQPRTGLGRAGMWDLAMSPGRVRLPPLCDMGKVHQEPKHRRYSLVDGRGSMRDHQPVGQKGQDVSRTGEVKRGSVAAPCPLGSHSLSSAALGVPFPILTPCLMPCPHPDATLTSLTRTPAYTVCLITMSVSGHWGAMGLHPDRQVSAFQGNGKGEWESKTLVHTSVPTSLPF